MEMVGLCRECGKPARIKCGLCGKAVCADHYDKERHACTACIRGKRI